MAEINTPSSSLQRDRSYQIECKFALEPSIVRLFGKARSAGWDAQHIALAIAALGCELLLNERESLQSEGCGIGH